MTAAALPARRREELDAKLASLDEELEHWKQATEEESAGLRRHHSQVRRLAATLEGVCESARDAVKALPQESAAIFEQAVSWENDILAAHSIWEIFRSRLVLRQDPLFRNRLGACDDLAWECYQPAMAAFAPDAKSPPLVYLTSTWSPFARSRDANFQNEVRATSGTSGALTGEAFQRVLKRLPVPLVGVPWYQMFYLPGTLLIAHEAGHVVEWDFDLATDIAAALTGAKLQYAASWSGWGSEVFADLYGCLAMGPAFVGVLIEFLAASKDFIVTEERRGGKYPTRVLRVELALRALVHTKHTAAAQRLRASWESVYGSMKTMTDFLGDADKVVPALCAGPYKGRALTDIVSFTYADSLVETVADYAAGNYVAQLENNVPLDPRLLLAAAQWLHEHQSAAQPKAFYALLLDRIVKKGANQFRFRGEAIERKEDFEDDLKNQEARDRVSRRTLRDTLFT